MRPFLKFAEWAHQDAVEMLIEHGLEPRIGNWIIEVSAYRYFRKFVAVGVPYVASLLLYLTVSVADIETVAKVLEQAGPVPVLGPILISWFVFCHDNPKRPNPFSLVEQLLDAVGHLGNMEGVSPIPADGHKWRHYEVVCAQIETAKQCIESISWKFAKRVALLSGNSANKRINPRWSRTARALLYAAEHPLNSQRRYVAYRASAAHITHLHNGRLFEPVLRIPEEKAMPELRPPRFKERLRQLIRNPITYTVIATLLAASLTPVLTALLRP